jgi:hypothetical protein
MVLQIGQSKRSSPADDVPGKTILTSLCVGHLGTNGSRKMPHLWKPTNGS